jgi:hypothetical protein
MKLAEALILRADKQKRLEQLKERLLRNVKIQEGTKPAEKPEALLAELETLTKELGSLIQKINRTNSVTKFDKTRTIADVLAERVVCQEVCKNSGELVSVAGTAIFLKLRLRTTA